MKQTFDKVISILIIIMSSTTIIFWAIQYHIWFNVPRPTLACSFDDKECLTQILGPSLLVPIIALIVLFASIIWLVMIARKQKPEDK